MKSTVIVSKVGSTFFTREEAKKNSSSGEQGETEGVVKHLLSRGDLRVLYFGQWRGNLYDDLTYVESCIGDLSEKSSAAEQKERWNVDVRNLSPFEPRAFINVAGYASTLSMIDNPNHAGVQACGIRYVAPALNAMQRLSLPRIVVNNDPRSYPRDGEMTFGWDWCRPRALLSQRTSNFTKMIQNRTYVCREVYAGAENWCEHVRLTPSNEIPCTLLAHAHVGDGCKELGRDVAFAHVLAPASDVATLKSLGMRVYGAGWKMFCNWDPKMMLGVIRPDEVMRVLAAAKTCPAVAAGDNFYTGKLRTCLAQRCLPLFYGRGEPFTFDPLEKYVNLNDMWGRVHRPGDLLRAVDFWNRHDDLRNVEIDRLWEASRPNFSLLDQCVDDILSGRDVNDETWWEKYGGYRCVR